MLGCARVSAQAKPSNLPACAAPPPNCRAALCAGDLVGQENGTNATPNDRHCHHRRIFAVHGPYRLLGFASRFAEYAELFSRRQYDALVYARHFECVWNVRYQRDDAAGFLDVCIRVEERVDSLAMADLQPDLSMVYLSAWLRRSNVMTGAEWIKTR